jgi:hypothetical protein
MWELKDNRWSKQTPRSRIDSDSLRGRPPIENWEESKEERREKWITDDLLTLIVRPREFKNCSVANKSPRREEISSEPRIGAKSLMSSAYKRQEAKFKTLGRPSTKMLNSKGPRVDPWITPEVTGNRGESKEPTRTKELRPLRDSEKKLISRLEKPNAQRALSKRGIETLSKALERSR